MSGSEKATRGIAIAEDPGFEERSQVTAGRRFHRGAEIVGARLLESPLGVEPPQPEKERIVADQPPQHVQHDRGLVVDERAEDGPLAADVPEAIAQVDRALRRRVDTGAPHLPQHRRKHVRVERLLGVERREVLCEPLAQPLLVIVLPAYRLAPPLMRQFVREIELGKLSKFTGIVAPDVWRRRQHLIEHREVRRAVASGQFVLGHGQREGRIRRLADDRSVVLKDGARLLGDVARRGPPAARWRGRSERGWFRRSGAGSALGSSTPDAPTRGGAGARGIGNVDADVAEISSSMA